MVILLKELKTVKFRRIFTEPRFYMDGEKSSFEIIRLGQSCARSPDLFFPYSERIMRNNQNAIGSQVISNTRHDDAMGLMSLNGERLPCLIDMVLKGEKTQNERTRT